MLNTAIKAARRAATVIQRASFDVDRISVTEKQHNDFVTDVDQAAEQAIIETLLKAYPDHAILAEESGASANLNDESEFAWIIDPIDGTTNFMHGYPNYCVSIALTQRGIVTQAVIYDPVRNDLYTASKGGGAYLNDKRIRVTKHDRLANTLLCSGHGAGPRALSEYMKMYGVVAERCQAVRSAGSAALELANVAAGRSDGFYEKGLKAWDIAAGSLLVTEAGGICGEFNGESAYLHKGDIIAASPKVFGQMVTLLAPFA
ncbi:inositol monophosphatase family protein [Massilia antarctica]|uniref:inositol monophosphatase family protein n=1 Tax=Massilia antarctica TaxID=2765360 RepID=UPI0006BB8273|nr:inositol monophosphatase family protein [Massilia sp. H27-R4]MCY0915587.1 inositol monophosphatase family protein [Massilia sp. H27-R4]CUI04060.1 Inositol-1-monophosphatase [Janthinobacterium sp. CG23_2]CUU27846.1 Inositol-1-monophosphatase [Janthinobacterium sp. CG23_2]